MNSAESPQIHKSTRQWRYFLNSTLQCILDVHVWQFKWIVGVLVRKVTLDLIGRNSRRVERCIILLKLPKFVGIHNGHKQVQVITQGAYVPVTSHCSLQTYQRPYITPTAPAPYHQRDSTSMNLNRTLLPCRVHGFMRLLPYPYTSIHLIQLGMRLLRPGNVFSVINSPMEMLTGPGKV